MNMVYTSPRQKTQLKTSIYKNIIQCLPALSERKLVAFLVGAFT